jgi:hypothetical protein
LVAVTGIGLLVFENRGPSPSVSSQMASSRKDEDANRGSSSTRRPSILASGRLPQSLQGISLGMALDEVMAKRPDLRTLGGDLPTAGRTFYNLYVFPRATADELALEVEIADGQVIRMESSKASLSPSDATEFQPRTALHLGMPDVVIPPEMRGHVHDDEVVWVWTDGDVKIRFRNSAPGTHCSIGVRPRRVSLEIVYWPSFVKAIDGWHKDYLEWKLRDWGVASVPPGAKQIPRSGAGLELGMRPPQVRAVYPTMRIYDLLNGNETHGDVTDSTGTIHVEFWQGVLFVIDSTSKLVAGQFSASSLGTPVLFVPAVKDKNGWGEWSDGITSLELRFNDQGPPWNVVLRDVQKYIEFREARRKPDDTKYEEAPRLRSFL